MAAGRPSADIAAGGSVSSEPRWAFLPFQLLLVSPFVAPVWIAGLVALLRDFRLARYRFVAWMWLVLAAVFIASGGKPYYLAGLLPVLLAAGGVVTDSWLDRGAIGARKAALVAAMVVSAVVDAVIALPVLPVDRIEPVIALNEDVGETVGWPELAQEVAAVAAELPRGTEPVVFTANYGEAGAIDRFGPDLGLQGAHSGHNAYADWPPPSGEGPVIVVGISDEERVNHYFRDCRLAAEVSNDAGIENVEHGAPIWACSAPSMPWPEIVAGLRTIG